MRAFWNHRLACRRPASRGFTITELVVVSALLTILAGATFPLIRSTARLQREMQLRHMLAKLRHTLDDYKRFCDAGLLGPPEDLVDESECYPADFETLMEPIQLVGQPPDTTKRFLRRIPTDPMTGEAEWGMRSYQDDVESEWWGGENIYDVYSLSVGTGTNGIPYSEW